jgi:subtilisin family serine protease
MSSISAALGAVLADGRLSNGEWYRQLDDLVAALPRRANEEARELIGLWETDAFTFDAEALRKLAGALHGMGYVVGVNPLRPTPPPPSAVPRILASNISEQDPLFAALQRAVGRTDENVTVAVLDGGFDVTHPALEGKLWTHPVDGLHGWDVRDDDADLSAGEAVFHGTHVTGLATQGTSNLQSVSVRVFDEDKDFINGPVTVRGLEYAIAQGARVINLSFKVERADNVQRLRALMKRHPEVLFILAAGNERVRLGTAPYTADRWLAANVLPNLIVVSAAGTTGAPWPDTSYGAPQATVAAPGARVLSTNPGQGWSFQEGTSSAAPQIANAAARCLLLDPTLSPEDLKQILVDTADVRPDWEGVVAAGGMANPLRATRLAALGTLVAQGVPPAKALARLDIPASEHARLLALI